MYKVIDSSQCNNDLVLISMLPNHRCLIINKDEIIYLKTGYNVIIDKTLSMNNKPQFDYDNYINFEKETPVLYEYNKLYIKIDSTFFRDYCFSQQYFFRGTNRALYLDSVISSDNVKTNDKEVILNRKEIEQIFNKDMYDGMYIIKHDGIVKYCSNKTNGLVIDKKIIPSDEEIIKLSLNNELTIDDIKNIPIYGSNLIWDYNDMLLIVNNGKFELKWFRIEFIEKDKFKLVTRDIPIIEPTVDDLLNYHIKKENQTKEEAQSNKSNNQKVKKKWFKNI